LQLDSEEEEHAVNVVSVTVEEQGCHADVFKRTDGRTDRRSDDGHGGVRDLDAL
jgi:hypothetical protein